MPLTDLDILLECCLWIFNYCSSKAAGLISAWFFIFTVGIENLNGKMFYWAFLEPIRRLERLDPASWSSSQWSCRGMSTSHGKYWGQESERQLRKDADAFGGKVLATGIGRCLPAVAGKCPRQKSTRQRRRHTIAQSSKKWKFWAMSSSRWKCRWQKSEE